MEIYRDSREFYIFFVLIPFINAINYSITYTGIKFNSYFLMTLGIDTLQGYMTWLLVRWTIFEMEKKSPLLPFRTKRLVMQLTFSSFLALSAIALSTELINLFAKSTPVPLDFYTHDLVVYLIWILVINAVYVGIYFYGHYSRSEAKLIKETSFETKYITVTSGKRQHKISFTDIRMIYVSKGYYFLTDTTKTSYLINYTLDQVEEKLPSRYFFRVNRSYLLHRRTIFSYHKIADKRLQLTTVFDVDLDTPLVVSRLKAKSFKAWFFQDSTL